MKPAIGNLRYHRSDDFFSTSFCFQLIFEMRNQSSLEAAVVRKNRMRKRITSEECRQVCPEKHRSLRLFHQHARQIKNVLQTSFTTSGDEENQIAIGIELAEL